MTIEQRVAKLERQNRWMRRIGVVGLALVAAIVVWPSSDHEVGEPSRSRDPKVNSLQEQLELAYARQKYIQSKLGIEQFNFRFPFPQDKQLGCV